MSLLNIPALAGGECLFYPGVNWIPTRRNHWRARALKIGIVGDTFGTKRWKKVTFQRHKPPSLPPELQALPARRESQQDPRVAPVQGQGGTAWAWPSSSRCQGEQTWQGQGWDGAAEKENCVHPWWWLWWPSFQRVNRCRGVVIFVVISSSLPWSHNHYQGYYMGGSHYHDIIKIVIVMS